MTRNMDLNNLLRNLIDRVKNLGSQIVDNNLLTDKSWFIVTTLSPTEKVVFIFRKNGDLLLSRNGTVSKAKWETINHATNSIIIEQDDSLTLFNILILTNEYLLLQKDGTNSLELLIKQEKYNALLQLKKSIPKNVLINDLNQNINLIASPEPIKKERIKRSVPIKSKENSKPSLFKNPISWYISTEIRQQLANVELIGINKYQDILTNNDLLVKDNRSKRIIKLTLSEWKEVVEKYNYIILIDCEKIK